MGLLDDMLPPKKLWPCKVKDTADTLAADDAKILLDAVMDYNWKILTLEKALFSRGISLKENVIRRHRDKACSCWKI
jgi:hypothetical protein